MRSGQLRGVRSQNALMKLLKPLASHLHRVWVAIIFIAAITLVACNKPSADHTPPRSTRPVAVMTASVVYSTLTAHNTLIGTLSSPRRIQIFNQEEGRILRLPFYEGDPVATGEELVRLDDKVIRAQLNKANAERRQAELDLSRMQKLLARNAASQDEVARAGTALELAQAEESLQRIILDRMRIQAPFTGIVSERLKEPGDVVQTYTHILTLIDPSALSAEVHVSEMLLSEISVGDVVDIQIDALREHTYNGRINRIHPVIDPQSRQGLVEIILQPPPKGARPGQLARITVSTEKTAGLLVPFSALRHDSKGPFVYRIEADDTARRNPVRTGLQIGDRIEILEGLSVGDQVIVSGLVRVSDGKKVRIVNEEDLKPDQTVLMTPKPS